jgi:hypothetical protein
MRIRAGKAGQSQGRGRGRSGGWGFIVSKVSFVYEW